MIMKMLHVVNPGWNDLLWHHGKEAQGLAVTFLKAMLPVYWSQEKAEL